MTTSQASTRHPSERAEQDSARQLLELLQELLRKVTWQEALARACAELLEGEWARVHLRDELGGYGYGGEVDLSYRPAGRWRLSVEPGYQYRVDARQYVDRLPRAGFDRYVFASIERSTLSAQLRLNVAFTTDLTLELYAEPYAASGRFYRFGELMAPRSGDLDVYDELERRDGTYAAMQDDDTVRFGDPGDFNYLSFRSNLVLRWQWRQGSTFYLVWQQNRDASRETGRLVTASDFADALQAQGTHFVAVKLTYWLPVG